MLPASRRAARVPASQGAAGSKSILGSGGISGRPEHPAVRLTDGASTATLRADLAATWSGRCRSDTHGSAPGGEIWSPKTEAREAGSSLKSGFAFLARRRSCCRAGRLRPCCWRWSRAAPECATSRRKAWPSGNSWPTRKPRSPAPKPRMPNCAAMSPGSGTGSLLWPDSARRSKQTPRSRTAASPSWRARSPGRGRRCTGSRRKAPP